jgi:hypothetical protein
VKNGLVVCGDLKIKLLLSATFIPACNVDYLCVIYFWLRIVHIIKWSVGLCFRNFHVFIILSDSCLSLLLVSLVI